MAHRVRELALFNLGFDSKLRGCDLVALRVQDICHGDKVAGRAMVMQRKTHRPVRFEITQTTREAVEEWIHCNRLKGGDYLFSSRIHDSPHIGTRQYAHILHGWVQEIGLDSAANGTRSMRRTKASMIFKKTKNWRAVQILLGHTKLESTVRYLGIEVDDALEIAEQLDVCAVGVSQLSSQDHPTHPAQRENSDHPMLR
jgi:site-specific recombinase XerC